MAKQVFYFPNHPIDEPVKKWMEYHNISPTEVRAYTIERNSEGMAFISVDMYYEPPPVDVTGIDRAEKEYIP